MDRPGQLQASRRKDGFRTQPQLLTDGRRQPGFLTFPVPYHMAGVWGVPQRCYSCLTRRKAQSLDRLLLRIRAHNKIIELCQPLI